MDNKISVITNEESVGIVKSALGIIRNIIDSYHAHKELSKHQRDSLVENMKAMIAVQKSQNLGMIMRSNIGVIESIQNQINTAKLEGRSLDSAMQLLDLTTAIMLRNLEEYAKY